MLRFPLPAVRRRVAALLAGAVMAALSPLGPGIVPSARAAVPPSGYWLVASDGGVFSYGDAGFLGSTGAIRLNQPIAGMAPSPSGRGYWMVASDGGIFSFGDAGFFGSTGAIKLNKPIVGMTATPSGKGYWMVASDGGIFSFGDAGFFGSTGAIKLNKPIVGMAATPSGKGYWLVASDGGIFSYGDARFFGSTGAMRLNQPIVGMAATPSGSGYWMSASDGGVFSYGDARFHGAAPERAPKPGTSRKVVSMIPTASGLGYWQVAASGELLAFGDAPDLGHPASVNLPVVGMAGVPAGAGGNLPAGAPDPGPAPADGPAPTTTTTTTTPPAAWTPPQFFSSTPNPTWGTSPSDVEDRKAGRVLALAEVGDRVFVAGEFAGATPPGVSWGIAQKDPTRVVARPFLLALDRNTGALLDWDARPNEAVLSLAPSPDGRVLYAGGRFRSIGGAPAGRVAALDVETGQQIASFQAPLAQSGVKAMALAGNRLFIGGDFTDVGGVRRPQIAALDAATGALLDGWDPPSAGDGCFKGQTGTVTAGCDGLVFDMAVTADGKTLFVGGDFVDIGDQSGLVALDAATGKKASWQPFMERPVFGVAVWPGDGKSLIVSTGGTGGQAQFFKAGSKNGAKPTWVAKVDGDATDITATTARVYLVGHYDFVLGKKTVCGAPPCEGSADKGDTPNRHLSVFSAKDGAHDVSFTAQANTPQGPYVAMVGRDHLYVGGDFTEINGGPQPGFVQFNAVR